MALFFETPLPFTANLSIVNDVSFVDLLHLLRRFARHIFFDKKHDSRRTQPELGRCFVSQRFYKTGEVLFTEKALVWASFAEEERLEKTVRKLYEKAFSKASLNDIDHLLDELTRLESVQSLDTAKNLLQLVALTVLRQHNEIAAISDFAEVAGDEEISLKMHYLDSLTAANIELCIADIVSFRKAYPKVIPKSVSNENAGRLLGVLNTNQLELEQLGGSGLFVGQLVYYTHVEIDDMHYKTGVWLLIRFSFMSFKLRKSFCELSKI